jgi:hypothetical protein
MTTLYSVPFKTAEGWQKGRTFESRRSANDFARFANQKSWDAKIYQGRSGQLLLEDHPAS